MGNEKSVINGLKIDEEPSEMTDFWIHYNAKINLSNLQNISLFVSDPSLHCAPSFGKPSPLERATKNSMIYRHPCILKYISSWKKNGKFFLATEEVRPLIQNIQVQSTLQICIGLHRILRALIFLHENVSASHNNVCKSSVYITPEGSWKLGGLEYLCKFVEVTPQFFQKIQTSRYKNAISSDENITTIKANGNLHCVDGYAFAVLVEEVLKSEQTDEVPGVVEFKEFCTKHLQYTDCSKTPKLETLLEHPFFTHEFIKIYVFLEELPVKTDAEKQDFFSNLVKQLRTFPEKIVAEQLGHLLLSRLVLLNSTAQIKLLPSVLKPRDENDIGSNNLFIVSTYKNYLIPKLLNIFCIRDASIRLLLLSYLEYFVEMFQTEDLKTKILPELLVGIKDTNDHIVCETLRALARLVPILGAATVVGGNRNKLFTDGRPLRTQKAEIIATNDVMTNIEIINDVNNMEEVILLERPSPDGGEDGKEISCSVFVEEESPWSDWEVPEKNNQQIENSTTLEDLELQSLQDIQDCKDEESIVIDRRNQIVIADITELDIKHSTSMKTSKQDIDFFSDMVPVINKTQVLNVETISSHSKFNVKMSDDCSINHNAWGDGLSDWEAD